MKRQDLSHLLRAACQIAQDEHPVVVGSQSILGSFDEDDLPPETVLSLEADIAFLDDADRRKADEVEGALGELSPFHETNTYYAEGVHLDTLSLPDGWRERMVTWQLESSHPAKPLFLDPHDLAVAKLVAHREKDTDFVGALLKSSLLDPDTLRIRAQMLPSSVHPAAVTMVTAWIDSAIDSDDRLNEGRRSETPPGPRTS